MQKRTCNKCKIEKNLEECFYTQTKVPLKYDYRCKECHKNLSALRHQKDYCPKKQRIKSIKRRESGKLKESRQKMVEKYPEKYKARYVLRNAVAWGKVNKLPCEVCGEVKSQGHHPNYSKPLEVIWLCRKHHMELHRKYKEVALSDALSVVEYEK